MRKIPTLAIQRHHLRMYSSIPKMLRIYFPEISLAAWVGQIIISIPSQVFGEIEDDDTSKEGIIEAVSRNTEVDWFRNLDNPNTYDSDWEDFLPNKHTKDDILGAMPQSLKDAIYSFLIGVTIRRLRGDKTEHQTMLVHNTVPKVQKQTVEMVDEFIEEIYAELAIKQIEHDGFSHSLQISKRFKEDFDSSEFAWDEIEPELDQTASLIRTHIYAINGDQKDVIDEDKYPNGLVSIRIGGDKLSRGANLARSND